MHIAVRSAVESPLEQPQISAHELIHITTSRPTEFIDLTDRLTALVSRIGLTAGLLNVQTLHTTTAIVLNEDEPLLRSDFEATFERVAPLHACYQHDRFDRRDNVAADERVNGHAHCRTLLLGASVCLNVVDGRPLLGRWQRVLLAELDGPRDRVVSVALIGHACRRTVEPIGDAPGRREVTAVREPEYGSRTEPHRSSIERRFEEALGR
jgi:secondary thiamine-phosphate synthase enzyme